MWTGAAVIAPLWQGSSITSGQQAVDGAGAVAVGLLGRRPLAHSRTLQAPIGPRGIDAVGRMRTRLAEMLATFDVDEPLLLIGGDCSVDLASLDRSLGHDDVTVLWLDAHADANTPESSPSGAAHGMVARTAMDQHGDRLVYVGVRATDPEESRWIEAMGIPVLGAASSAEAVMAALPAGNRVHLHLDLDVLDPGVFSGVGFPEPGGMPVDVLISILEAVQDDQRLLALTVTEHVPGEDRAGDTKVLKLLGDALR